MPLAGEGVKSEGRSGSRAARAIGKIEMCFMIGFDFNEPEAVCLAQHPDGGGDFIRYATDALPRCCRWISRTVDQDCLGLALPGTAEPEGMTAERKKGNIIRLGARESYRCSYQLGSVNRDGAQDLASAMEKPDA